MPALRCAADEHGPRTVGAAPCRGICALLRTPFVCMSLRPTNPLALAAVGRVGTDRFEQGTQGMRRRVSAYNPSARGDWCIGNTVVSKTATRGSTPRSPVWLYSARSGSRTGIPASWGRSRPPAQGRSKPPEKRSAWPTAGPDWPPTATADRRLGRLSRNRASEASGELRDPRCRVCALQVGVERGRGPRVGPGAGQSSDSVLLGRSASPTRLVPRLRGPLPHPGSS
jgi:hypothetical protein